MVVSKKKPSISFIFLKICFFLAVILAITGSLWWTVSISTVPRNPTVHGYRRLQEQLLLDLQNIGEISLGSSRSRELDSCSEYLENYVPCFNVSENIHLGYSDGEEFDRHCSHQQKVNCLVLTPVNYKVPLRWPTGRDVIWVGNVKITAQEVLSSGSLTKRMMMLEEEQISFRSESHMFDGVEDYSHQIAEMIGLRNQSNFINAGIRVILDIGCGYGSFGAHLFSKELLTMCIATYESSGSQVQLTLERGLPAMIGSFNSYQLPYPALSYDLVHCSRCGIDWDQKGDIHLLQSKMNKPFMEIVESKINYAFVYFLWMIDAVECEVLHLWNVNEIITRLTHLKVVLDQSPIVLSPLSSIDVELVDNVMRTIHVCGTYLHPRMCSSSYQYLGHYVLRGVEYKMYIAYFLWGT